MERRLKKQGLNEKLLRQQIDRFKDLPIGEGRSWGAKGERGLRDELFEMLWKQAFSDDHAKELVDRVMATATFVPSPAAIVAAAEMRIAPPEFEPRISVDPETGEKKPWEENPELCSLCQSIGYVGPGPGKYTRCGCVNGQELAQVLLDMVNNPASRRQNPAGVARGNLAAMRGAPAE